MRLCIFDREKSGGTNFFLFCCSPTNQDFFPCFTKKNAVFSAFFCSGVQIRSRTHGDKPTGRVNGPQVEIEATDIKGGGEAGYIYGEATSRGWLVPDDQRKAHKHFKDGAWNHYRVVAKGPRIQVWINGNTIIDLNDPIGFKSHPKGFLGLQVHGVGKKGPFSVAWKNIKIKELK